MLWQPFWVDSQVSDASEYTFSDIIRQVLYPAAAVCMVMTLYMVAHFQSRIEQPTYYPPDQAVQNTAAMLADATPQSDLPAGNDCPTGPLAESDTLNKAAADLTTSTEPAPGNLPVADLADPRR